MEVIKDSNPVDKCKLDPNKVGERAEDQFRAEQFRDLKKLRDGPLEQ